MNNSPALATWPSSLYRSVCHSKHAQRGDHFLSAILVLWKLQPFHGSQGEHRYNLFLNRSCKTLKGAIFCTPHANIPTDTHVHARTGTDGKRKLTFQGRRWLHKLTIRWLQKSRITLHWSLLPTFARKGCHEDDRGGLPKDLLLVEWTST